MSENLQGVSDTQGLLNELVRDRAAAADMIKSLVDSWHEQRADLARMREERDALQQSVLYKSSLAMAGTIVNQRKELARVTAERDALEHTCNESAALLDDLRRELAARPAARVTREMVAARARDALAHRIPALTSDGRYPLAAAVARVTDEIMTLLAQEQPAAPTGDAMLDAAHDALNLLDDERWETAALRKALRAACVLRDGKACFRTANDVPMAIPPRRERIIRAALAASTGEQAKEGM